MRGGIAKIIPSVKLTLMLPSDVMLKMNLHLYSPVLARIPKGSYQKFLCELINEFFDKQKVPQQEIEANADDK